MSSTEIEEKPTDTEEQLLQSDESLQYENKKTEEKEQPEISSNNNCSSVASEEGSDSEEETQVEPKLKYERIGNDLKKILGKDSVSTIAVHSKFLCIGSHWGRIYLLDHMGNSIKELKSHSVVVNHISIDARGDYIASCSDDGCVVINCLSSDEKALLYNFERKVRTVAIDLNYNSNGMKRFVTGDTNCMMMHELALFNRLKSTVLSESVDTVHNIKWRGQFLAWATDEGMRLYNLDEVNRSKRNIGIVRKMHDSALRTELYPCHICWKSNAIVLIGWADTVRVCTIARRAELKVDLSHLCIEILYRFVTDFFIAGIGPFENNNIVLLGYCKEVDKTLGKPQRPQMIIVEPGWDEYSNVTKDILSIRGFGEYRCSDYHFIPVVDENMFFVASLKDIVIARTRDTDDHVQWLIQHAMFQAAMEKVLECKKEVKRHKFLDVAILYLDFLLKSGRFDEAGKLCVRVCGNESKLWKDAIFMFEPYKQLRAVCPYIPTDNCQLEQCVYETVLNEFLRFDINGFLYWVREWPPSLYNVPFVTNAVIEHLLANSIDNTVLLRALAILYTYSKKYHKAMAMYLRLNDEDVFELIRQHKLFDSVPSQALELIQLNHEKAISLFLDHTALIPPETVIEKLKGTQKSLYIYLDALYKKESKNLDRRYHGELVKMYATYDQSKLLPFLRNSDQYPIQTAMDICETHNLIPERVYLLGRMGNTQMALELITEKLMDIDQAVDFCKEHDDPELWSWLINFSLDKPQFINVLLQNIGTHVDPQILIQKISNGLEIPGLRDSLAKIMHDYNLQISLQEGYKKILVSDCANLMTKLTRAHLRGLGIDVDKLCESCHTRVIHCDSSTSSQFVIFNCKHSYHESCLHLLTNNYVCCMCHPKC